jgi:hypothetical protein
LRPNFVRFASLDSLDHELLTFVSKRIAQHNIAGPAVSDESVELVAMFFEDGTGPLVHEPIEFRR